MKFKRDKTTGHWVAYFGGYIILLVKFSWENCWTIMTYDADDNALGSCDRRTLREAKAAAPKVMCEHIADTSWERGFHQRDQEQLKLDIDVIRDPSRLYDNRQPLTDGAS